MRTVTLGVERGAGHHLLEQVHAHRTAARPRHQHAAGREQLHGQQVEVLVRARDAFSSCRSVLASFGGSSRIRSYCWARSRRPRSAVNASASISSPTSTPFSAALRAATASAGPDESIDSDADRAAGCGDDAERTGVAEHVEHASARRPRAPRRRGRRAGRGRSRSCGRPRRRPRSGSRPRGRPDRATARCRAADPTRGAEAFALAHVGVAALVHARDAGQREQRVGQHLAPGVGAGGGELADDGVAVAVGDQAGHAVGLAEHQPCRVGVPPASSADARGRRGSTRAATNSASTGSSRVERPHPRTDLRRRAVRRPAELRAVRGAHQHGVARRRANRRPRRRRR